MTTPPPPPEQPALPPIPRQPAPSPPGYGPSAYGQQAPPPGYRPVAYGQQVPPPGYVLPPGLYAPPPPPVAPGGQRLAEFTDRLVARIIDTAILGGVTSVVIIPIYFIAIFAVLDESWTDPVNASVQPDPADVLSLLLPLLGIVVVLFALALLFAYLYDVEMMFRSGQTLGKRIMKIRIIPVDPAQSLTRALAVRRFLVQHVAVAFVPLLNWIDGLWQLWDKPYRQCLHDKFATTLVIKLNP